MKNNKTILTVDSDELLLKYLLKQELNKSKNNIKSLLAHGQILVDGKKQTKFDFRLKKDQQVTINWSQIRNEKDEEVIDIVYEDQHLLVINKTAGLLSIASEKDENSAFQLVASYIKKTSARNKLFVVHRLDKETSGLLIFAKGEQVKNTLQNNWDDLVKLRGYIAVVEGNVAEDSKTLASWLKETKTHLVYSGKKTEDAKYAVTKYKKIASTNNYSLLDIEIETGRKNQIRVHLSDMGHPIVGDKKYGAKTNVIKRLALHAYKLEFTHPVTNEMMHFELPIPKEFKKLTNKPSHQ